MKIRIVFLSRLFTHAPTSLTQVTQGLYEVYTMSYTKNNNKCMADQAICTAHYTGYEYDQ